MEPVGEWPKPFKDLIVTFENGAKCYAVYTGDGWMFNCPLGKRKPGEKVVSYNYVNPEDDK